MNKTGFHQSQECPTNQETANKPAGEIRIGAIKAAIWTKAYENGTSYNVTFSRIYKSGDEWRRTESFGRDDLLTLAKVADLAHTWVCEDQNARRKR